jgi:hypothetical protein
MRKKFFCILPIYVLLFLFSCSQLSPQIKENLSFKAWTLEKESPRVVAILPFLNQTEEKEIEDLVRKSFYSHFSVKSFSDIEIYKVDETIALMERINSQKFFKIPPQDLGRNLHADALVYGEVIEFTRVFMGIYSQIAVGAKIKIVDATSGKPLWEDFFTTRFHEGDIPLTPLNVPLSAAKSGMNLREVQVIRAIDDLSWNLVKSIPDPAFTKALPKKKERLSWGLQVASFEQVEGAKETLQKFKEKSYQVFLVTVEIQGKLWYRLMMGPFESEEESREWKQKVEKEFNLHPIITEINVTIQESEARI